MSIDLNLEALGRAARACKETADTFEEEADSALEAARALGFGWQGEGYAAFSEKVESSAVPMAHMAADACRSLAEGMEEAHELGESLLLCAENFGYDLGGTGGGSGGSRLFFDEDVIGPIEADIINTETSLAAAQTAFMKAEAALSRLTTCSVSLDSAGFSAGLANISRGLDTYKESLSTYRSGMEGLETLSARVAQEAISVFSLKPTSEIVSDGKVQDPTALAWWLARPYESLSDEERALVDTLKEQGFDAADKDLIEDLLSAAGYTVDAHDMAFKMVKKITKYVDPEMYGVIKTAGVGKGLGAVGWVLSGLSASYASFQYYDAHPELPEDRRLSNQSAEWDLQFARSAIGVLPPIEDWFDDTFYSKDPETNMSIADQFYEWRYETFGKYGL